MSVTNDEKTVGDHRNRTKISVQVTGKHFSGSDVERNTLPTRGIDLQPQSRERFCLRIRRHALLLTVTAKLPANDVFGIQRRYRLEHLDLFIANRIRCRSCTGGSIARLPEPETDDSESRRESSPVSS